MKRRGIVAMVAAAWLGSTATAALAQEEDPVWYLRGSFNDWGLTELDEIAPDHFQTTVFGLTPGEMYEFKVADEFWTEGFDFPGSNAQVLMDETGMLTVNFFPEPADDGWLPEGPRVGWVDLGWSWEVMGSFNEWSEPVVGLTDLGDGVHQGEVLVPEPGDYWFKLRMEDNWDFAVGDDFGHFAGDVHVVTEEPDQTLIITLDLPNGRLRAIVDEAIPDIIVGDMNFDGVVDTGDVAPFVLALTDPQAYQDQFGVDEATMLEAGDINADGAFDTGDVAPFVQMLVGGGAASVPEPGSLALLGLGGLMLLRRRR